MGREHLQNPDVSWGHEPAGIPLNRPPGTFSPTGGEGWDEGERFMESLHGFATAHFDHERWGETPSSLDQWTEVRARRESRPTRFMERQGVRPAVHLTCCSSIEDFAE